jgi:hypothetical protein
VLAYGKEADRMADDADNSATWVEMQWYEGRFHESCDLQRILPL